MTPYEIAKAELGTTEVPGTQNNPRILEYHATTTLKATTDEVPWCSSFVNWCCVQAGIKGTNSAAARSWLKWGKQLKQPVEGCVAVFKRGSDPAAGHVAFFVKQDGDFIYVLGGNQGGTVKISKYKASDLLEYRG
jgi:uncharacterized protein (TIGR02594 family)